MRVSVIGGSTVGDRAYATAREVGRLLGDRGYTIVCGGLGGAMEAACRGGSEAGGTSVGILPGERTGAANQYVDTPIATGMGNARNVLVVLNGDGVVAVDGAAGTLSELGHALDFGKPVAGIDTPAPDGLEGYREVQSAEAAVEHLESCVLAGD